MLFPLSYLKGNEKENTMKDYNGIEIPTKVKASKIEVMISLKYVGKYGTEERHVIEDFTLEEWCGIDDVLKNYEIEYEEI